MKYKVLNYDKRGDFHDCRDENGRRVYLDLMVSGCLPDGTKPNDLIGKTVECEDTDPYISIAYGVKVVK